MAISNFSAGDPPNPFAEAERHLEAVALRPQHSALEAFAAMEVVKCSYSNMEIVESAKEFKRVLCPSFVARIHAQKFENIEAALEACTCLGACCGKFIQCFNAERMQELTEKGYKTLGMIVREAGAKPPDNVRRIDREVESE